MKTVTKREIKELAGVESDRALALWWRDTLKFPITPQAVNKWPEDSPLPELRLWQLKDSMEKGLL